MYRKDIIGYVLSGTLHTLTNFHTPQTIIVTMLLMRKLELMNKSKSICPRSSSLEDAEPELARSCLTMARTYACQDTCYLPTWSSTKQVTQTPA